MQKGCHHKRCANITCEEWEYFELLDFGRATPKWTIDPASGLCAKCLHRREVEQLLGMSTAIESALDEYENGGIEQVEAQLGSKRFVSAFAAIAKQLDVVAGRIEDTDPDVAGRLDELAARLEKMTA